MHRKRILLAALLAALIVSVLTITLQNGLQAESASRATLLAAPTGFTITSPTTGSLVPCGQPITVTWTGGNPTDNVNLVLIDQLSFSEYQGFGVEPNTGSRVVTIGPGSCGRASRFYVEDSPRTTWIYGPVFNVECANTFNIADGDVAGLIAAINSANASTCPTTINLAPQGTYTLTTVVDSGVGESGAPGPAGLPYVRSPLTINGNGSTIQRSNGTGTPDFVIVAVSSSNSGVHHAYNANLTLNGVTLTGATLGGLGITHGVALVQNSTITQNLGGGIKNFCGKLTLVNSTVSYNTTGGVGGGIYLSSPCTDDVAQAYIAFSTIFENQTAQGINAAGQPYGPGYAIEDEFGHPGDVVIKNSILASPTRAFFPASACSGGVPPTSAGHNIGGDNSCGLTGPGDMPNTNPLLGPLANNGGLTPTHMSLSNSPAIDAVPLAFSSDVAGMPVTTDQRGISRPQGVASDIGSVEAAPTAACTPPPPNMVSWWPGDGNANDIQDGNNGALQGGAMFAPGKVGQAFSFDGTGGFVNVPDSPNLNLTQALTIDAWINPSGVHQHGGIVEKTVGGEVNTQYSLHEESGRVLFRLIVVPRVDHRTIQSDSVIPINTWTHVAGTWDGITMKLFINGVQQAQTLAVSPPINSGVGPTLIGYTDVNPFAGLIDEVEIFNRALSSDEIRAIYLADTAGKCKPAPTPTPAPTPVPQADLSINKTATPSGNVSTSSQITYTLKVNNNGPGAASNASVSDPIPSGATFSSVTTIMGSCTAPSPGSTGTVNCSLGTLNAGGSATITVKVDVTALPGATVSNTATVSSDTSDPNPNNNSSSTSNQVSGCNLVVTNTDDGGAGSLREAILCANVNPGLDTITFNISGTGVHTIAPLSGLQTISDPLIIDGTTEPGFAGSPLIELNGANAGSNALGLIITGGNSRVKGLVINGFARDAIQILTTGGNVIEGNFIGTNASGNAALGNIAGITIIDSPANLIGGTAAGARNVVSGNTFGAVTINGASATGNIVQGNFLGTDVTGTVALPNHDGVGLRAPNNVIGGTVPEARNVMSGNLNVGIYLGQDATGNQVMGNFIGTDVTGTIKVSNLQHGVDIGAGATNNIIGGTASGARNLVSGNGPVGGVGNQFATGIDLFGANNNTVQGNFIGTDVTGTLNLGNAGAGVFVNQSSNNLIGGTGPGARNLVSGNGNVGIEFVGGGSGNQVQGNYIGTNASGSAALGNSFNGVDISSCSSNTIGGTSAGAGNVISGNGGVGLNMVGGSSANLVQGNLIGTNAAGTAALPNIGGVSINTASNNNTIGGTTPGARNIISGNNGTGVGIFASSSTANTVQGNYVGPDITGMIALGNNEGLVIGGSNNLIGGAAPGAGNLISANRGSGISLFVDANSGNNGSGNTIQGNLIGTDVSGAASLGNRQWGVVSSAANNVIGGTSAGARNVISGNSLDGIAIFDPASGNLVQGNYIGTNAGGSAAVANSQNGINITAPNNTIGGVTAGSRNIISGNSGQGIGIFSASGMTNTIQGNYIGTDVSGAITIGNSNGLLVGTNNNLVGGAAPGAGNLISGNRHSGVAFFTDASVGNYGSGNTVQGNLIGTDVTGTIKIGNTDEGVAIGGGSSNVIGGTAVAARNVISGNSLSGVSIYNGASANLVQGNFIGTDITGTSKIANLNHAVDITTGATNNVIGGTAAGAGNVISGSGGPSNPFSTGVDIFGANGNFVQGNFIGTDVTGTLNLGNAGGGVFINQASNNLVGGTATGARNVISGNGNVGVGIVSGGTGNQVQGNFIGTNAAGTARIPNGASAVSITDSPANLIGGTSPAARNVISGNNNLGVFIGGAAATGNLVQGNYIGTAADGISNLGNTAAGIRIEASNNIIGGIASGAGNVIAYNGGAAGVRVTSGSGNAILSNSIFSNSALGIDLVGDGVTLNSPCGPHTGPNKLQNFPVLTSVLSSGGGTSITGTLNSAPNTTFRIEFFSNAAGSASGFGQGQTFIGAAYVTTGIDCNTSFGGIFPVAISGSQVITATATDPDGNTSEFSNWGTTTIVSSNNSPSTYGQSVTFTATARSSNIAVKDGAITFKEGTNVLSGPTAVDANGRATFSTLSLSRGTHTITAVYSSLTYSPSSGQVTQTVNAASTTTLVTSSANPSTYGDSVSFTATVSPNTATGAVQFKIDGSNFGALVAVINGTASSDSTSSLTAGSHTVTAVYSGDNNFSTSTGSLAQSVNRTNATINVTNYSATYDGHSHTAIGTVTGVNGESLSGLDLSSTTHTNAGDYPNDPWTFTDTTGNYNNTSGTAHDHFDKATTVTTETSSKNPSTYGESVSFTANVSPNTAHGMVQFKIDGNNFGSPVTITSGSASSGSLASLSAGTHSITAVFSGDNNFSGSTSPPLTQTVNTSNTATSLMSSQNPSASAQAVTFTATVSAVPGSGIPSGTVTFFDGTTALGTSNLNSSGQATFTTSSLTLGTHSITATYDGDANFNSSTSPVLTQLVFAYPAGTPGGTFVIGDRNATVGSRVTFWGDQWAQSNSLSGGAAPSSFKGFANSTSTQPANCGGTWTSDPANSSGPPSSVPQYIAVMVSTSITKSGSTISGNTRQMVVIKTDAGYDSNPGHPGTGTVVAVICQ